MTQAEAKAAQLYPPIDDAYSDDLRYCSKDAFTAGHKEGAIAFAKWVQVYNWIFVGDDIWYNGDTEKRVTTNQVYEQFNNTNQ